MGFCFFDTKLNLKDSYKYHPSNCPILDPSLSLLAYNIIYGFYGKNVIMEL